MSYFRHMRNISHIFIFLSFSKIVFASQISWMPSFSEILLNENDEHHIFTCEVIDSYYTIRGFVCIAERKKVYRGAPKDTVRISLSTFGSYTNIKMLNGTKWLIIAKSNNNIRYHASILQSKPLTEKDNGCINNLKLYGNDLIHIITEYYTLKKNKYSGDYQFKYKDRIIAKGKFKDGKTNGRWQHLYYHSKSNRYLVKGEVEYKNGIENGTIKRNTIYYEKERLEELLVIEDGKIINKQDQFTKYADYKYPTKHIRTSTEFDLNEDGDTILLINYRKHLDLADQNLYARYRHGNYLNLRDSMRSRPLAKGQCYKGAMVGDWEFYDKQGNVVRTEYFEPPDTSYNDFRFFDEQGNVRLKGNVVDGKPYGIWQKNYKGKIEYIQAHSGSSHTFIRIGYSENGKRTITPYLNNQIHGVRDKLSKDGQLLEQARFVNGVQDGKNIRYSESGEIIYASVFKNGLESTVYQAGDAAPIVNGAIVGYHIQRSAKTGQIIEEGEYWKGYRIGKHTHYQTKGGYTISHYEVDKTKIIESCHNEWIKLQTYNNEGKLINEIE